MPQPPQVFESSSDPAESHQRDLAKRGAAVESVPPRKHRKFTVAEKLRIVKAAEAAVASGVRGKLEALLRKEGIYSSLPARVLPAQRPPFCRGFCRTADLRSPTILFISAEAT